MSVRGRGFREYLPLRRAVEIILSNVRRLPPEEARQEAAGRVLAVDAFAKRDVPPFDRSAADGFAVIASDTFGASPSKPVRLRVMGTIFPGQQPRFRISKKKTVRVMTGAMLPAGADAVVPLEQTKAGGQWAEVLLPITPGKNVSQRGEDVRAGEKILEKGRILKPQDIGLLAAAGCFPTKVFKRPRVAIISTGEELVEPWKRVGAGKLPDVNYYSISAAVKEAGGLPVPAGRVRDDLQLIKSSIKRALKNDVILISGGASVGERDFVPEAISEMGRLLFHGVSIRPGGPSSFGLIGEKPVFSLPGFPVAALIAFKLLVRPAINVMQGLPHDHGKVVVKAKLLRDVASALGRADVVRVRFRGRGTVEPVMVGGSGILSSMTAADGFIIVDERREGLRKGERVEVEVL